MDPALKSYVCKKVESNQYIYNISQYRISPSRTIKKNSSNSPLTAYIADEQNN